MRNVADDRVPSAARRARLIRLAIGMVAGVVLALPGDVRAETPRPATKGTRRPAPVPVPPPGPAAEPVVLPDPPTPVIHAREVGLGQCAPILERMSRQTLTGRYDVQSGWFRADASRHIFQSLAALTRPGNTPPDGIAALVAAPVAAGGCDGVALQVFPLAGDCQTAQKAMLADGTLLAPMLNTRIMLDGRGNRILLLPAYNDTCIAIAVDSYFGTP